MVKRLPKNTTAESGPRRRRKQGGSEWTESLPTFGGKRILLPSGSRPISFVSTVMCGVASSAERDQVLLRIVSGAAAEVFVVDLEIRQCAAGLASPAVPTQNLMTQPVIRLCCEPQACAFRSDPGHDAFSVTWCRNVCLSSPGRNLKNRSADCKRTPEFSFSRFAPARKSAQIISRQ